MISTNQSDKLRQGVAELLASDEPADQQEQPNLRDACIDKVMEEILNGDTRSAQQNVARLRSYSAFFSAPGIDNTSRVTLALIEGIELACNLLFKRSSLLFKMKFDIDKAQLQSCREESLSFLFVFFGCFLNRLF